MHAISGAEWSKPVRHYSASIERAVPEPIRDAVFSILAELGVISKGHVADVIKLAVLGALPPFLLAVANGGWLRWRTTAQDPSGFLAAVDDRLHKMMQDRKDVPIDVECVVLQGDARRCQHLADDPIGAVITSPPYPNRHDYTRVFQIELEMLFLDAHEVQLLRRQTIRSHPEAKLSASAHHDLPVFIAEA